VRPRLAGGSTTDPRITLAAFVELYLQAHAVDVSPNTLRVMRSRLRQATKAFGDVPLRDLERMTTEIRAWRATLPAGSRRDTTQSLRQVLSQAVRDGTMTRNPAKLAGPNPAAKRAEIQPFTPAELEQLCAELGEHSPLVRFAAATGLRPCEFVALEHRDVRRDDGVLLVERSYARGLASPYGKTANSRRRVPLSQAALQALADNSTTGVRLVFPDPLGGHLNFDRWRSAVWAPALQASGLEHRTPYSLRHLFATNALAAGISLYELARFMGTSTTQIDRTYGHLAHGSEQAARERLDSFGR
jgi:integrase